MKIISKFTDFYDYYGGYDTDNRVIYHRVPRYFLKYKREHPIDIDKGEQKEFYNNLLFFRNAIIELMRGRTSSNKTVGFIEFQIIGIYPEIRIIPLISIYKEGDKLRSNIINPLYNPNDSYLVRNKSLIDIYTDKDIIFSIDNLTCISEMYDCKISGGIKLGKNEDLTIRDINYSTIGFISRIGEPLKIKKEDLMIENSEFFFSIHSPVFYMSKYVMNKAITDEEGGDLGFNIVTDCNFSDLKNIDIEDIKKDINIRSRIESFLIKEKELDNIPEEASNDVKIVSHGFDLKTSFRKM